MSPFLAAFPIVVLIVVMTVQSPRLRLPLSAHCALPFAALLSLILQFVAGADNGTTILAATVIEGLLTSLLPLSIVFGAILLFRTLRDSGALNTITGYLEHFTPDPVLRVLLIAWAFSYLIEGLSGFGTPAALAAPLLVGLGFPPVRAAAACLVMNTVPVVFGAVGTPIWFGLGEMQMDNAQLQSVAFSAAIVQAFVAPVVVVLSLGMLFSWHEIRQRLVMIAAIVAATVLPAVLVAAFSAEFPSIIGGLCGLIAAFVAGSMMRDKTIQYDCSSSPGDPGLPLWRAVFPLALTVILLAITRIEPIGLKALLNSVSPDISTSLGTLGDLSISAALVVQLENILGTDIRWSMALLYVPFIIPFVLVALGSAPLLKLSLGQMAKVTLQAGSSLALPALALAGALVFVKLMMHGGDAAPVIVLGRFLADLAASTYGPLWYVVAPVVGVLGSFFSGSATVSNLTFAPVQSEVAAQLGLDAYRVLALQAVGAAIGNMVCVHNIVAVAAVLGLSGRKPSADSSAAGDADQENAKREKPVAMILRMNAIPLAAALGTVAMCTVVILIFTP